MSKLMTLTDLSDDCLMNIIEYLDFTDQVVLWRTTGRHTRLSSIVCRIWQRESTISINYSIFENDEETIDELLKCIQNTIKLLELINIPIRTLEQWIIKHDLSHLQSLACCISSDGDNDNNSDYMLQLIKLFPTITFLHLRGNINLNGITNWKHLLQLDICQCDYISNDEFQCICEQLKLQKLRVGIINRDNMNQLIKLKELEELEIVNISKDSIQDLIRMPKLQKLGFGTNIAWNVLNSMIPLLTLDNIVGITFHNSITGCSTHQLLQLKTVLKRLTLINECYWRPFDKNRIVYDLPLLEQLHVVETNMWDTAEELWEMVATCPRLHVLYISGSYLDSCFFNCSNKMMYYALSNRSRPLALHLHHMEPLKNLIRHHFRHKNLKLSFDAVEVEYIKDQCIKVEFLPHEISNR